MSWQMLGRQVADKLKSEGHVFVEFTPEDRAKVAPVAKAVTDDYIAGLEGKGKKARDFYDALQKEMSLVGKPGN